MNRTKCIALSHNMVGHPEYKANKNTKIKH